jgi:hypothetical protein
MMTNLESLVFTLVKLHPTKAYNGEITTAAEFVPLATVPTLAQTVYISNTFDEPLFVKIGEFRLFIPKNTIFPVTYVSDLQNVFVQLESGTPDVKVSFRYEA